MSLSPNEKRMLFVAPGSLEIPNNRGGGIEQNIFFLTQNCSLPSFVFSPRRKQQSASTNAGSQSRIIYSIFNARKDYPPSSQDFFSMLFASIGIIPFYLDAAIRILILNNNLDSIVVFNKFMGILPLFFARITKKKTIYMEYNIWPWCYTHNHKLSLAFWIHIAFWKIAHKLSSTITANSPSIKEDMLFWGADPSKVFLLPTGIEIKGVTKKKKRANETGKFVVLYAGRLVEERGADQLPAIIKIVLENQKNVLFRIVGGGPLLKTIICFVEEQGLEESVEVLGQRSRRETIELIQESDVVLFISRNENYGSLALLECMASGCPVITTNVGSTKELIINGVNGILVNPEPNTIAQSVLCLSRNKGVMEKISTGGRVTSNAYCWEQIAKKFVILYKK
jgi:glycosyltransferase involved in cell wall biosynthesis